MSSPTFQIGSVCALDGAGVPQPFDLPADHLVTHAVVVGMTGSGKTGLVTVMVEEALRSRVPVLMVDVKGDLADLALAFPQSTAASFAPWLDPDEASARGTTVDAMAADLAAARIRDLAAWGMDDRVASDFRAGIDLRVITPGSHAGEPLHVLSALERRSPLWDDARDLDEARASLASAISLVLRLLGRDPDPARSREHVLLAVLAERRLRANEPADLATLLHDLATPPVTDIGAMTVDDFLAPRDRAALAASLNALLASPTFAAWRTGTSLDVAQWMTPRDGRTPAVIVSVAHLDDTERTLVLGLVLDAVLAWVRSLPGSSRLRGLVVFDEVYGFLPPHPANPPTKRPLVALMKQARAFGVGMVLATQNPMDLDYRALSNAGLWFLGRLQTDADRARVVDGMALTHGANGTKSGELSATLKQLGPRWFVTRDVHAGDGAALVKPRHALSWLRGPLTASELKRVATGAGAERSQE